MFWLPAFLKKSLSWTGRPIAGSRNKMLLELEQVALTEHAGAGMGRMMDVSNAPWLTFCCWGTNESENENIHQNLSPARPQLQLSRISVYIYCCICSKYWSRCPLAPLWRNSALLLRNRYTPTRPIKPEFLCASSGSHFPWPLKWLLLQPQLFPSGSLKPKENLQRTVNPSGKKSQWPKQRAFFPTL